MPRPQKHLKNIANSVESPLIRGGRIEKMLKEVLEKREAAKPPRLELHVSDAGRCPRQIGYRLTQVPKSNPPTFDSLMNFAIGEAIEDRIASLLEAHPDVAKVHRNIDFEIYYNGHTIHGHADILIETQDDHVLIECKSINSRSMGFTLRSGENGKEDHQFQISGYLYGSHAANSKIIPRTNGVIAYIIKDPTKGEPNVFEANIEMNAMLDKLFAEYDKLCEVERLAEKGEIMPQPEGYTYDKYPCTYCDWQKTCWGFLPEQEEING